jgi:hypothetical protein
LKSNTKRFRYILGFLIACCAVLALLAPSLPVAAADTYTIKIVVCAGGAISYNGTVVHPPGTSTTVNSGENIAFDINADSGKEVQEVMISYYDHSPVYLGDITSYTYENIQNNFTFAASFSPYSLKIKAGSATQSFNPDQFDSLPGYGATFSDNKEDLWQGVPLYALIQQVYPGTYTDYEVKAITSDPANNDIPNDKVPELTNNIYPFLDPDKKNFFIVADQYSPIDGSWGPVPPASGGNGSWTWNPLRLIGNENGSGYSSGFQHYGAGLLELEITNLPPWITTQPGNKSAKSGSSASFTAAANGDPAPTVQWQVSEDDGSTWSDIEGATGSRLTLKSVKIGQSGNQYRAVFTNNLGSAPTDTATLTVTSSGGGGGGGGGGGSTSTSVPTDLFGRTSSLTVNSSGVVQGAFTAASTDGTLSLTVPAGTTLKDASGSTISSLSETTVDVPPSPPGGKIIAGPAFDLEPGGATFSPPITFTYSYDPSGLPAGIEEADLAPAFYDTGIGVWTNLPGTVDETKHTLTVLLSHFTTFAVMGTLPPAFTAGLKGVSPREADPGEKVNITFSIANNGGKDGEYPATLLINGKQEQVKNVSVEAGCSSDVVFSVNKEQPGEYTFHVGNAEGRFAAVTPAVFSLSELSVQPAQVKPAETVTVSVKVSNTGGKEGSYPAVLMINGEKEQEKSLTLASGSHKTVVFELVESAAGEYRVAIGHLEGGFTVEPLISQPPASTVTSAPPAAPASSPASTADFGSTAAQPLNWTIIGGILAAVVLLLVCFILLMRRRKA